MAEQRLQPLIQQAYGQPIQGLDTTGVQEIFTQDVAKKEKEYKTALDIGSDLSAKYYSQIGDDLNNIIDEASQGDLTVGSPEWLNKVSKFRNKALQTKQIQDTSEEMGTMLLENPDNTIFYYENKNGERVAGGYDDYLMKMDELLAKDYENISQLQNEQSKLLQGFKPMKQGFTQGFQNLRKDAQALSKELLSGGGAERKVSLSYPGLGAYTATTTSALSDGQVQNAITTFVDQYGDLLTDDFYVKKRNGAPMDAETPQEYIKNEIDRMLIKDAVDVDAGRYSVPREESNKTKSLRSSGSGWEFGDFYGSFIKENIAPEGEDPVEIVNGISVEHRKTNPQQDWTLGEDEGARALRGSLVRIFSNENGEIMLKVRTGGKKRDIPYAPNYYVLETEYGLTENDINKLLSGRMGDSGEVIAAPQFKGVPKDGF